VRRRPRHARRCRTEQFARRGRQRPAEQRTHTRLARHARDRREEVAEAHARRAERVTVEEIVFDGVARRHRRRHDDAARARRASDSARHRTPRQRVSEVRAVEAKVGLLGLLGNLMESKIIQPKWQEITTYSDATQNRAKRTEYVRGKEMAATMLQTTHARTRRTKKKRKKKNRENQTR